MIMHANAIDPYLRRIREEWDAILNGTTLVQVAEILGHSPSTIMRRNEKADRLDSWPMPDVLAVAYALRKQFPGFHQAISKYFARDLHTTRCMSNAARASEVVVELAETIRDIQIAAKDEHLSKPQATKVRAEIAQAIDALAKYAHAIDTASERKP